MNNLSSRLMKRFNHLLGEIDAVYHEMDWKLGLSDSAMAVLYTICDNGGCCLLQDICLLSGLSKQTVNSALRRLEADGILYLEAAGSKAKKVRLTESGKLFADQTAGQIIKAEDEIFDSWPQEDVNKYLELTEAFLTAIKQKAENLVPNEYRKGFDKDS